MPIVAFDDICLDWCRLASLASTHGSTSPHPVAACRHPPARRGAGRLADRPGARSGARCAGQRTALATRGAGHSGRGGTVAPAGPGGVDRDVAPGLAGDRVAGRRRRSGGRPAADLRATPGRQRHHPVGPDAATAGTARDRGDRCRGRLAVCGGGVCSRRRRRTRVGGRRDDDARPGLAGRPATGDDDGGDTSPAGRRAHLDVQRGDRRGRIGGRRVRGSDRRRPGGTDGRRRRVGTDGR